MNPADADEDSDDDDDDHTESEPDDDHVVSSTAPAAAFPFDVTSAEGVLIQKAHQEKGDGESVVLHNEGATELFKCIEEVDWERAASALSRHPEQAAVWVVSTGTVNTTFNWSLWKRLPLHEAARRQAPLEFMTALISAHPAAVQRVTQFGELPLHLAVECGSHPSVVNLLAVHHWMGCHTTDQSGRTPFDILDEASSLLDPMEHKAVYDALHASVITYQHVCALQADALAAREAQHAQGLEAVRRQHDADLALEMNQQEELVTQVTALSQQLTQQVSIVHEQERNVQNLQQDCRYWKDKVAQLELENAKWKQAHEQQVGTVQELRDVLTARDAEAVALADRIVDLQTAMTRLAHWHQTTVQTQLTTVNQSFQTALSELSRFTTTLTDHEEDLQTLLFDMGVEEDDDDDDDSDHHATEENAPSIVSPEKHGDNGLDDDDALTAREDEEDNESDDERMMRAVLQYAPGGGGGGGGGFVGPSTQ
jgi:predicted lactoylglutathione lyase